MKLSPDQTIFWQHGFFTINLTLVTTWALMLVLIVGAKLITRKLTTGIVRLFGNIMSGGMIVAILLTISPFIFPVIMNALGLLTGMVQAYIFSILATVYITAAVHDAKTDKIETLTTK